jgi:hypothetical protein
MSRSSLSALSGNTWVLIEIVGPNSLSTKPATPGPYDGVLAVAWRNSRAMRSSTTRASWALRLTACPSSRSRSTVS